jgi:hypothetical protein
VYRLESLDFYDAPNEREPLADFRAGRPVDQAWRANWKRIAEAIRDSGPGCPTWITGYSTTTWPSS